MRVMPMLALGACLVGGCATNAATGATSTTAASGAPASAPLPPDAQAAFDAGYERLRQGDASGALPHYARAVELAPRSWDTWLEYSGALRQSQHLAAALRAAWIAVELGPDRTESYKQLGSVLATARDYQGATDAFMRAAELAEHDSGSLEELVKVGYWAWGAGDDAQAARALEAVLAKQPKHVLARIDHALLAYGRNDVQGAVAEVEAALADADAQGDARIVQYGRGLLAAIRAGHVPRGISDPYQVIPDVLRHPPTRGEAAALRVPSEVERVWPLGASADLHVTTPERWDGTVTEDDRGLRTLKLIAPEPGQLELHITSIPKTMGPDELRGVCDATAQHMASNAVEQPVPVASYEGQHAKGCTLHSTDKTRVGKPPEAFEYLHYFGYYLSSAGYTFVASVYAHDGSAAAEASYRAIIASLYVSERK